MKALEDDTNQAANAPDSDISTGAKGNSTRFAKGSFIHNVLIVLSGSFVAQVVGFALLPVLSRMYTPEDFGSYGVFLAVAGMIGAGATLQLHQALVLPERDEDAANLLVTSVMLVLVTAFISLACLIAIPSLTKFVGISSNNTTVRFLIPLAVLGFGLDQSVTAWCVRRKAFNRTASSQVIRSVSTTGSQLIGGGMRIGSGGLILGSVIGSCLASAYLLRLLIVADVPMIRQAISWRKMRSSFVEYRDFPLFANTQSLISSASLGLPVILLTFFYGVSIAGFFSFGVRPLRVPLNLITTSVNQVFLKKITDTANQGGDLRRLFRKSMFSLLGIVILPALLMFVLGPQIFAWVFGAKWYTAGEYARWMILPMAAGFCASPAMLFGRVLRKQQALLVYQIVLSVLRVAAIGVGGLFFAPLTTVKLYCLVDGICFLGVNIWISTQLPSHSCGASVQFADQVVSEVSH